jgi:hypothetical protein
MRYRSLSDRPVAEHEADLSLTARSFRSAVLTLDRKSVPIRNARNQGGKVVYRTSTAAACRLPSSLRPRSGRCSPDFSSN